MIKKLIYWIIKRYINYYKVYDIFLNKAFYNSKNWYLVSLTRLYTDNHYAILRNDLIGTEKVIELTKEEMIIFHKFFREEQLKNVIGFADYSLSNFSRYVFYLYDDRVKTIMDKIMRVCSADGINKFKFIEALENSFTEDLEE